MLDRSLILLLTVLSVALLTLWLRSHIVGDRYRWVEVKELEGGGLMLRSGEIWSGEGGVAMTAQRHITHDPEAKAALRRRAERRARWAPMGFSRSDSPAYPVRSGDGVLAPLGIDFDRDRRSVGATSRSSIGIGLPLWIPILLIVTYPLLRFIRGIMHRERQERILLGLCPRCGVDVRHAPPRCPCCGLRQPLLLPQQRLAA